MLSKDAQIKLLEKKVLALETQMLFVIEMIGAPDADAYERELRRRIKKQEQATLTAYLKGGGPCV